MNLNLPPEVLKNLVQVRLHEYPSWLRENPGGSSCETDDYPPPSPN
jgi:hypothetical protein